MNAVKKITLELEFEEFNALDVLIAGEAATVAENLRRVGAVPSKFAFYRRVMAVQSRIEAARPPQYREHIAAAYAARDSVCD